MTNKYYIGNNVNSLSKSEEQEPYKKLSVIVGTDDNGNQIVHRAYVNNQGAVVQEPSAAEYDAVTGRELVITNPLATPAITAEILTRIKSYRHHPFSANDAFVPDQAELGDGIIIGDIYSVLVNQDITFDGLGASNISSPGADETENEFGLTASTSKVERDIIRKTNTISTKFTVELGKIESEISDTATGLSTRITQNERAITSEADERVTGDNGVENRMTSLISQTASDISFEVKGNYAPEWTENPSSADGKYYAGDVVKRTTTDGNGKVTAINFYKCKVTHTPNANLTPENTPQYWDSIAAPTVQSMIDMNLDGITLSYDNSEVGTTENAAFITLNKDGIAMGGGVIRMTNVVADSMAAGYIYAGTIRANQIDVTEPGVWANGTLYHIGDIVYVWIAPQSEYFKAYYQCKAEHTSSPDTQPYNGSEWQNYWRAISYQEGSAKIQASQIDVDNLTVNGCAYAQNLKADSIGIYSQNNTYVGSLVVTDAYSSNHALDIQGSGATRLKALNGTLYLSAGGTYGDIQMVPASGKAVTVSEPIRPNSSGVSCGTSRWPWSDVYAANATIQTSDRTKKKDIDYSLDIFDSLFDGLKPCSFRFIDGHERKHFGLIAQDVEELLSNCGFSTLDLAAFIKSPRTEIGEMGYDYGLRYSEFIPLLIYEVQKLKTKLKELGA